MHDEEENNNSLLFNLVSDKSDVHKTFSKANKEIETFSSHTKVTSNKIWEKKHKNISQQSPVKQLNSSQVQRTETKQPQSSSLFSGTGIVPTLKVKKKKPNLEPLFSTKTFEDLDLHPHLVSCLKSRLNIVKVTKVQEQTIPVLLEGQDALVKSCTGSGKTLSYAVPIVQKLREIEPKIKRSDGVLALVIVPTRELALQCFDIFSTLTKSSTWIVPGYLIGGEKKKAEKARLRKGINVLISTPGRLLDHLDHTASLSLEKVQWLIIDEADRLLEQNFEGMVGMIVSKCNKIRQSALLSATLSKGVEILAGVSLRNPVCIGTAESSDGESLAVPRHLRQLAVVVPAKLRLVTLSGFLADGCAAGGFKALVFLCSQASVDFHHALLSGVLAEVLAEHRPRFFKLHGNMQQEERTEIFKQFKAVNEGVLLCTDVGARGLDLPAVNWIVQYSAPPSAPLYVHRVGRTARIGRKGNALLFLLPSESNFSHLLAEHNIHFDQVPYDQYLKSLLLVSNVLKPRMKCTAEECATALQNRYESEVYAEDALHESAKEAYKSYIQSYTSYPKAARHALPFKALHLGHIAKSYCLREAPSTLKPRTPFPKQRKPFDSKGVKRSFTSMVSEYDNGLASFHLETRPKKRKS